MTESKVAIEAEFTLLRKQIQGIKRRKLERFRCPIAAMGKLQFPNSHDKLDVWVINLSKGGIGINISHPIDSGAEVTICLKSDDQKILFHKSFARHPLHAANRRLLARRLRVCRRNVRR